MNLAMITLQGNSSPVGAQLRLSKNEYGVAENGYIKQL